MLTLLIFKDLGLFGLNFWKINRVADKICIHGRFYAWCDIFVKRF